MSKPKGFAAMPKEKRTEISRKGGKAAHAQGVAHEWDAEGARRAGRIGGLASQNRATERSIEKAKTAADSE